MQRKLYPPNAIDRFGFWIGLANLLLLFVGLAAGSPARLLLASASVVVFFVFGVYVFQSQPSSRGASNTNHDEAIDTVRMVREHLTKLDRILERQQLLAQDRERSLRLLEEEHQTLAPIVETQRERVEAILSSHARLTSRNAWKERTYGFASGVVASVVASYLFLYLTK